MAITNKSLARTYLQSFHTLQEILDGTIKKTSDLSFDKRTGICDNIFFINRDINRSANKLKSSYHMYLLITRVVRYNNWSHYSGCSHYPVGVKGLRRQKGKELMDHEERFIYSNNLWSGEYGRRRRELLKLCIEFLEGRE